MDVLDTLKGVGMSENKARVYVACLELGVGTAAQIAKKAHIHRTSVYEILKDIHSDGLISSTPKGASTLFTVERPEQLKVLLKEKERNIDAILPELRSRLNRTGDMPRVRFYEGVEGVRMMLADTLTAHDALLRAMLSITDFNDFLGKKWFGDYTNKRIAARKKLRVLRPESKEVPGLYPGSTKDNREVRLAPRDIEFSLSEYIYDNKVVLISTAKEGYGMIIESKEYCAVQLLLFETLWSVSRITKNSD
ncbi:MAG: helix-turn-helix domain-containing protein [Candidatus Uhrbacteria bacterium]|nr:helix-turn-helix domain-containing protein [Candidatus Uhrbacteria bacterium]